MSEIIILGFIDLKWNEHLFAANGNVYGMKKWKHGMIVICEKNIIIEKHFLMISSCYIAHFFCFYVCDKMEVLRK